MSRRKSILVVEDDALLAMATAEQFNAHGLICFSVSSGEAAIALLEAAPIDVLFTDVALEGALNGHSLAEVVSRRWPGTSVIVTSGYPNQRGDGALFIPKPYDVEQILTAIQRLELVDHVPVGRLYGFHGLAFASAR